MFLLNIFTISQKKNKKKKNEKLLMYNSHLKKNIEKKRFLNNRRFRFRK